MCGACSLQAANGQTTPPTPQDRRCQIATFAAILRPMGVTIDIDDARPGLRITAPNGQSAQIEDLDMLWPEVERLTGDGETLGAPMGIG